MQNNNNNQNNEPGFWQNLWDQIKNCFCGENLENVDEYEFTPQEEVNQIPEDLKNQLTQEGCKMDDEEINEMFCTYAQISPNVMTALSEGGDRLNIKTGRDTKSTFYNGMDTITYEQALIGKWNVFKEHTNPHTYQENIENNDPRFASDRGKINKTITQYVENEFKERGFNMTRLHHTQKESFRSDNFTGDKAVIDCYSSTKYISSKRADKNLGSNTQNLSQLITNNHLYQSKSSAQSKDLMRSTGVCLR